MPPHLLLILGSCPSASHCANDIDRGATTPVILGLLALILLAILMVKLGGPDKS